MEPEKHMFPVGDSAHHIDSQQCPCSPDIFQSKEMHPDYNDEIDITVVKHTPFDGRNLVIYMEVVAGVRCEDCLSYIDEDRNRITIPPRLSEHSDQDEDADSNTSNDG